MITPFSKSKQDFFPLDVLDEIWDVIESDSEGFLTYSLNALDGIDFFRPS